jgi:hypothetical protein
LRAIATFLWSTIFIVSISIDVNIIDVVKSDVLVHVQHHVQLFNIETIVEEQLNREVEIIKGNLKRVPVKFDFDEKRKEKKGENIYS